MRIYTISDWARDGSLRVQVGQLIDCAVFERLLDCVLPTTYSLGLFQVGEAYDHDKSGCALYATFKKNDEGWFYCGICRRGETNPREGICEKMMKEYNNKNK